MKTLLLLFSFALFVSPFATKAQNPNLVALFGVDGDVRSGLKLNGSFTPENTHDWFYKSSGSNIGVGIIDTIGASYANSQLAAGNNFVLTRGMSAPRYSVVDGKILLDARYGRDNVGLSATFKDSTIFSGGAKNGMLPSVWSTNINGTSVTDKVDIVDGYAHMRRNGTVINTTNPDHLILVMGASTNGTTGNRFIDLELYKSRIEYSKITGIFSNSGPAATGGHSVWTFDASGNLTGIGDMDFAFSFSSDEVTSVSVYVWVAKTTVENINPSGFDFAGLSEFYGDGNNADYGYAKIIGNNGASLPVWSSVNTATIDGPVWGTASKDIGTVGNSYYSAQYAPGQLAEIAIDLTAIGIEPVFNQSNNPCSPPFTRMMIKSRSSESFTSSLQDFTGPYLFLDAPDVPATIVSPASLKCNVSSVTLAPQNIISGAYYNWTTNDGVITTNPLNPSITVTKAGKYYLAASIYLGCTQNIDSVIVAADYFKPVATATVIGIVNSYFPQQKATLIGGDVLLSNYPTPFGTSAGLAWNWTGPAGFNPATTINAQTNIEGKYTLIVTELRNGCKDTADVQVVSAQTLPVKITEFSAVKKEQEKVLLKWTVMQDAPGQVELLRSFNGNDFSVIAVHMSIAAMESLNYTDNTVNRTGEKVFYKLRITEATGHITYSDVLVVSYGIEIKNMQLMPNPVTNYTMVSFKTDKATAGQLQLIDLSGKIIRQQLIKTEKGQNQVMVSDLEKLSKGMYFIRLFVNDTIEVQKLIKQ